MTNQYWSLLIVGAFVASLLLGVTSVPAMQPGADQSGIASAPQAAPHSPNDLDLEHSRSDAEFWQHARDPFAPPNAAQLCAKGLVQACALVLPSD